MLFFDGDAAPLLGADFEPGHTRLTSTSAGRSTDGQISVQQAMSRHAAIIRNAQSSTYSVDLYGINAVNDGSISAGDKVVITASTPSQSNDMYVMFHRLADPIYQAPAFGNEVIVHRQAKSSWTNLSYIITKLLEGGGKSHCKSVFY